MSDRKLESKYIKELRKEIAKLKRENSQLRKHTHRLEYECIELRVDTDDEDEEVVVEKDEAATYKCPKCKEEASVFILNKKEYFKCPGCGKKGPVSLINKK